MMPPRSRPEHHMRLDRRTARDAAGKLRYHHGFVVSEREARLGPGAQAGNGRRAIGAFRGKAEHGSLRQTKVRGGVKPAGQPREGTYVVEKVLAAVRVGPSRTELHEFPM